MNRPLIKYCGNKSSVDVEVVSNSSADFIGFIFAKSKRQVFPDDVRNWVGSLDREDKKLVGVFVNADLNEIARVASIVPLSIIQCHGNETKEDVESIKRKTNLRVWKVIHHDECAINKMLEFAGIVDGYVVDTKVTNMWGGTGESFDWSYIPKYTQEARRQGVPCFIAGGISQENVHFLLNYDIDGIDISSGIEESGLKSINRITNIEKQVELYEKYSK